MLCIDGGSLSALFQRLSVDLRKEALEDTSTGDVHRFAPLQAFRPSLYIGRSAPSSG